MMGTAYRITPMYHLETPRPLYALYALYGYGSHKFPVNFQQFTGFNQKFTGFMPI